MKFVVRLLGELTPVEIEGSGPSYQISIGERTLRVDVTQANRFLNSLRFHDGTQFLLVHHREGRFHEVSFGDRTVDLELFDPLILKRKTGDVALDGGGPVKAVMPGRIVRILIEEAAVVKKGDGLMILEAMKMENEIVAPRDGVVHKLLVEEGQIVEGGAELILIE